MPLKPYEDPSHDGNSSRHHTGKPCIEAGCNEPAGTTWSPLWCQACNAKRIKRINESLRAATRPRSQTDAIAALAKLIKKSGGSVRLHRPDAVQGQSSDDTSA